MQFGLTASTVLMMMAFAVPGYILIKTKAIKKTAIPAFSALLVYACQPFLTIYSFRRSSYTPEILGEMGIVFAFSAVFQIAMLVVLYFIIKAVENKKAEAVTVTELGHNPSDGALALYEQTKKIAGDKVAKQRVFILASTFGNVGFLGVPLLEALLPNNPETLIYSAVFIVSMNLICWTLGLTMLTGEKRYISVKRLVFNPPFLAFLVAFPIFMSGASLPAVVDRGIEFMARMTTPLCMIIMGMRFATQSPKELFKDKGALVSTIVKLLFMPLAVFLITHWLPISNTVKTTLYILSCMPTASVVLNLAELHNKSPQTAANAILVSTILSMLTIPLLLLLA